LFAWNSRASDQTKKTYTQQQIDADRAMVEADLRAYGRLLPAAKLKEFEATFFATPPQNARSCRVSSTGKADILPSRRGITPADPTTGSVSVWIVTETLDECRTTFVVNRSLRSRNPAPSGVVLGLL
jgi:hypothetical protein